MPELRRILYCSQSTIGGTDAAVEREIDRILNASRRNNAAAGLSGALLFTRTHFMQVLEGPADALEIAFERICADLRHTNVGVVDYAATETRSFGNWSMARIEGDERLHAASSALIDATCSGPATAERTIELMQSVLAHQIAFPGLAMA